MLPVEINISLYNRIRHTSDYTNYFTTARLRAAHYKYFYKRPSDSYKTRPDFSSRQPSFQTNNKELSTLYHFKMKFYSIFCIVVLCFLFAQVIGEPVPKSSKALTEENPKVDASDVIDSTQHSSTANDVENGENIVEDGEDVVEFEEDSDREIEGEALDHDELEPSTKSYYGGKCKKRVCKKKYVCENKKCAYYKTVKCSGGKKGKSHYSSRSSYYGGHYSGYCKKLYYKICKKCYYKLYCYYTYVYCGSKY